MEDISTLKDYANHYSQISTANQDKLVRIRSADQPFAEVCTLVNPTLSLDTSSNYISQVVPDDSFNLSAITYYLVDYWTNGATRLVLLLCASKYVCDDYNGTGERVDLEVLNHITPCIQREGLPRNELEPLDIPEMVIDSRLSRRLICGIEMYGATKIVEIGGQQVISTLLSDAPLEDRLLTPLNLTWAYNMLIGSGPDLVPGDRLSNRWFESVESLWDDADAIVCGSHNVPKAAVTVFPRSWYARLDKLVSNYLSTDLISFLAQRELAILRMILLRMETGISDDDIEFLGLTSQHLLRLFLKTPNAMTLLSVNMFEPVTFELAQNTVIKVCEFCGEAFRTRGNKKYCSQKSEGRDCGKRARNKRFYKKHQSDLREYYRREMQLTRDLYKRT